MSYGHRKGSGAYRYCIGATGGVPGVHREGPPLPEGLMGCMEKGTSPSGLGRHTPLGPMCLGFGGNPKGGAPLLGGQAPLPLAAAPLPPSPINRGVRGGLHTTSKAQPLPSPTPLLLHKSLAKPCRSTAASSPPRRHAAIGALFLNLSPLLAGSRRGRRPRSIRVLNAEVPSVWR